MAKPRLLVFPFGYLSHYLRCIALCHYWREHFDILFASHVKYDSFVLAAGFGSFACDTFDENAVLEHAKRFSFSWMNELALEQVFKAQVAVIKHLIPVAVLGDATPTLKMAAQLTGRHHISLINGYMSKHYAGVRCIPRQHFAYNLMRVMPEPAADFFTRLGEAIAFRLVHTPFKKLRARYSLPAANTFLDEYEGDTTLICDLPELFPQRPLPEGYSVIGPLLYSGEGGTTAEHWQPTAKKRIYVSMGSTGDWQRVAFLNDEAYAIYDIVTTGDTMQVLNAAHISPIGFTSAAAIMPGTALVICHGGNGTVYQALAYGVPLLCAPDFFEQEWNVAAIVSARLGHSLHKVKQDSIFKLIAACVTGGISEQQRSVQRAIAASLAEQGVKLGRVAARLLENKQRRQNEPAGAAPNVAMD
ncbi:MAG: glycosyltransferase [Bacteroidota bacterium]